MRSIITDMREKRQDEVMENLMRAHKQLADSSGNGAVKDLIKLTKVILRLIEKLPQQKTLITTEEGIKWGNNLSKPGREI